MNRTNWSGIPQQKTQEEIFWSFVEKDVGIVPQNIKTILSHTGFVNGALAELGDVELDGIESDMRRVTVGMSAELDECFRRFAYRPENFILMTGERTEIKFIARMIKEKGIRCYLKKSKAVSNQSLVSSAVSPTAKIGQADSESLVKSKIIDFYEKRYVLRSKWILIHIH